MRGLASCDLPLYNTELLAAVPEEYAPVVVCEGEKAADALTALGHLALATCCGAAVTPAAAVLGVLAGRQVVLWPDDDEPGRLHMGCLAEELRHLGAGVRVVDAAALGVGAGGDAADLLDPAAIAAALAAAAPYSPRLHGLVATLEAVAEKLPETTWLWPGWLPKGYMTLLAGTPGAGKSGLALALARAYLTGEPWPDGTAQEPSDQQRWVLWLETEDSHGILRDRCAEWGVPTDRILLWGADGLLRPELDHQATAEALAKVVAKNRVGFVVLDTLAGAHYQEENSANIKRTMQTLTSLAQAHDVPILALHHLRKRQQPEAEGVTLDRVRGSSAIAAAARIVLAAWKKPEREDDTTFFSVIKSNLGRPPAGLIVSTLGEQGPEFEWCEVSGAPSMAPASQLQRDVAAVEELCGTDWTRSSELREAFIEGGGSKDRYARAVKKAELERRGERYTGFEYRRSGPSGGA